MKFFSKQHQYYCGIDLHARKMYVCIIDHQGILKMHQNIKTDPKVFLELIKPCMDDLVVGVECVFCWYWLADLCHEHKITFVLGHALYMKAIHGGKTKNDKIDSYKPASLLRGGNFPIAYAYPARMRSTRDLLRRRMYISRRCNELKRFPNVGDFSSYARLIRPVKQSNGKWAGHSNGKIGNHHLKWAIKEASILMLRDAEPAKKYVARLERKYNKGKHKCQRQVVVLPAKLYRLHPTRFVVP
jgi:hypothetical protein